MFTQSCRPQTLEEMAGQEMVKKVLKAIIKDPMTAPKSLIFEGQWGTGKSTSARIFARAVNCLSDKNKPCLECENCKRPLEASPFYEEHDATVIGNVDKIRDLRDSFFYKPTGFIKVINIDECHTASAQAQTALLKVLEDSEQGIIFIFSTTHVKKLIPTIVSRSLTLTFETIPPSLMKENLIQISHKTGKNPPSEHALDLIVKKSKGHMRDAHMSLDYYYLIGEEDFCKSTKFPISDFNNYHKAMVKRDDKQVFEAIESILSHPIADLQWSYGQYMSMLSRSFAGRIEPEVEEIVKMYGNSLIKIIKSATSEWMLDSFKDESQLECALLCFYQMLFKSTPQQPQTTQSSQGQLNR